MSMSTIKTALMYGSFTKTSDEAIVAGKKYYVLESGVYKLVKEPDVADIDNYYEVADLSELLCIKSYGGFDETKEELETTTMCDEAHTYIEGLKANSSKTFTANYDKQDYAKVKALEGTQLRVELWFNENGADGKFGMSGLISVSINDGDVNAVREMTITVVPQTEVDFE